MKSPTLKLENKLRKQNYKYIAGIDEAGRGALAGPVVVAVVIMDCKSKINNYGIKDSKLLTPKRREKLFKTIIKTALAWKTEKISEKMIDKIGIVQAVKRATEKALEKLKIKPDYILADRGINLDRIKIPYQSITHGDTEVFSIACASILAKVTRDKLMIKLDKKYSKYGFAQHKGYGTEKHIKAIRKYSPCPIHRKSFAPIRSL